MNHDIILQGKSARWRAGYKKGYRAGYEAGYEAACRDMRQQIARSHGANLERALMGADAPPLVCLRRALEKGNE